MSGMSYSITLHRPRKGDRRAATISTLTARSDGGIRCSCSRGGYSGDRETQRPGLVSAAVRAKEGRSNGFRGVQTRRNEV